MVPLQKYDSLSLLVLYAYPFTGRTSYANKRLDALSLNTLPRFSGSFEYDTKSMRRTKDANEHYPMTSGRDSNSPNTPSRQVLDFLRVDPKLLNFSAVLRTKLSLTDFRDFVGNMYQLIEVSDPKPFVC